MALTPGTRLGPYEITAQIGVGGRRDGRRFLLAVPVDTEGNVEPLRIIVVENWHEELKRLVPAS